VSRAESSITIAPEHPSGARRFSGFVLDRPLVMGILNVTPDSFSDGGSHATPDAAVEHAHRLVREGADIVDVGGESTRPGSEPVDPDVELARVLPVVRALAAAGIVVSIDTRRAMVMRAALAAGARIVNDITALTHDRDSLDVVARSSAGVILMHMQGEPQTMQRAPAYADVVREVRDYLAARVAACRAAGVAPERIAVDPGIGFGKTVEHNLQLLAHLGELRPLGTALVLGASRKGFIGAVSGRGEDASARLPGSLAAALAAVARGADIVRVHDVAATVQALAVWRAVAAR
jgi:dihydropteroate synthase